MSDETKWTPGPWRYTNHGCIKGGEFIQFELGESQQQVALATSREDGKQIYNAHLIASAPELYSALSGVLDELRKGMVNVKVIGNARAALAKARGETS